MSLKLKLLTALGLCDPKQPALQKPVKLTDPTETRTLELLVVEDSPKHITAAREYFEGIIADGAQLHVTYATTYEEAQKAMQNGSIGAIISDVFFPQSDSQVCDIVHKKATLDKLLTAYTTENPYRTKWMELRRKEEYFEELCYGTEEDHKFAKEQGIEFKSEISWFSSSTDLVPLGVLVMQEAEKQGIPTLLYTDQNHHAQTLQPVLRIYPEQSYMNPEVKPMTICSDDGIKSYKWAFGKIFDIELTRIIPKTDPDYKKNSEI